MAVGFPVGAYLNATPIFAVPVCGYVLQGRPCYSIETPTGSTSPATAAAATTAAATTATSTSGSQSKRGLLLSASDSKPASPVRPASNIGINTEPGERRGSLRPSFSDGDLAALTTSGTGSKYADADIIDPSETAPLLPQSGSAKPIASLRLLNARVVTVLFFSQMLVMISYQVYDEIFTLWASSAPELGGLGFTTHDSGIYFGTFGIDIIVASLLVYPLCARRFSPLVLYRVGTFLAAVFFVLIPFSREALTTARWAMWVVLCVVSFLGTVASGLSSPSISIIINGCAPTPELLGRLNGILQAAIGIARVVGRCCFLSLFAFYNRCLSFYCRSAYNDFLCLCVRVSLRSHRRWFARCLVAARAIAAAS